MYLRCGMLCYFRKRNNAAIGAVELKLKWTYTDMTERDDEVNWVTGLTVILGKRLYARSRWRTIKTWI